MKMMFNLLQLAPHQLPLVQALGERSILKPHVTIFSIAIIIIAAALGKGGLTTGHACMRAHSVVPRGGRLLKGHRARAVPDNAIGSGPARIGSDNKFRRVISPRELMLAASRLMHEHTRVHCPSIDGPST